MDHIVPSTKGGGDDLSNLALCCYVCNSTKGAKTHARDPETAGLQPIFNPRRQGWSDHFEWSDDGLRIVGLTPVGRATIAALRLNRSSLLVSRQVWVQWGVHPPATRD